VHYTVIFGDYGTDPAGAYISAVTLSGFSRGCNEATVELIMSGNAAGDPSAPADLTLSSPSSALDTCTQAPLANPVVVKDQEITLRLCPTGGAAGYASVKELTQLQLLVNGTQVPVLVSPGAPAPARAAPPSTSSGSSPQLAAPTTLPRKQLRSTATTSVRTTTSRATLPVTTGGATGKSVTTATATTATGKAAQTRAPPAHRNKPHGSLAFTGADIAATVFGALVLIVVGLFLMLAARRHQRGRYQA
jgi:hypothetical protein